MVQIGPLVGGAMSVLSGLVFWYVGTTLAHRELSGSERLANRLFVLWWYALAAMSLLGAGFNIAAAWGVTDLALHTVLLFVVVIVLCAALWALGYYLAFLYTGSTRLLVPLGAFYSFYAFLLLYLVVAADPVRVVMDRWSARIEYAHPDRFAENSGVQVLLFLFVLPQLVAALAYMSLLLKVHAATQQYRIAMVSGSILIWLSSGIVASVGGFNEAAWWVPTSRLIALFASFGVLLAYRPPRRLLDWLSSKERVAPLAHGVRDA